MPRKKKTLLNHPLAPLAAVVVLMGGGAVVNHFDQGRQERQGIARAGALSQVQQRLEQEASGALNELAKSRYSGRCVLVEGSAIAAGMNLADAEGRPLADNTPVCDSHGNTAIMHRGQTTHVASTNNDQAVQQFLGW